jgi:alpha-tubulin suppressor-like RCC1 family protein
MAFKFGSLGFGVVGFLTETTNDPTCYNESRRVRRKGIENWEVNMRRMVGTILSILCIVFVCIPSRDAEAQPTQDTIQPLSALTFSHLGEGGDDQNCAITIGGGLKCWGDNRYGQLGDGTNTRSNTPVDVFGLSSGVTAVAADLWHTCAIVSGGGLKCWGGNWDYQLGNGTHTDSNKPVDVSGLTSGVAAVTAGAWHTCALTSTGGVKCWGYNYDGEVGNGTLTGYQQTPGDVVGLTGGVQAISAGGLHTCALLNAGTVQCWGDNGSGELGNGGGENSGTPVNVSGLSGVTAIAAGDSHTCALLTGGAVKCWGSGGDGQLGNGGTSGSAVPTDVVGLPGGMAQISSGDMHSCARLIGGGVNCWGFNGDGQLGDGTRANRSVPVAVVGLGSGELEIAVGGYTSCALMNTGEIKCWGDNGFGQLGSAVPSGFTISRDVLGLADGVLAMDAGQSHTCAVDSSGKARCWGGNSYGQLGDGTLEDHGLPAAVLGGLGTVQSISAGFDHTCAVTGLGGVKCWGRNSSGSVGDNSNIMRPLPADVVGLSSGVRTVSAGAWHTCALTDTGGVKCWGTGGTLGNGDSNSSFVPVDVSTLGSGVQAISAGYLHTCALINGGAVKCWGWNDNGYLGDGTKDERLEPVDVLGLGSGVLAVSAGGTDWSSHTCALISGGAVKCWGENGEGQLGTGTTTDSLIPVEVVGLGDKAIAVAAGGHATCAILESGETKCWGSRYGLSPVGVAGLAANTTTLSGGGDHSCALAGAGRMKCWGSDWRGLLGVGGYAYSKTPVDVSERIPRLALGYSLAGPGSILTLSGWNYPPGGSVDISVNGQPVATAVPANATGEFVVFLDTGPASAGSYRITVGTSQIVFFLVPGWLVKTMEGGGTVYSLPAGVGGGLAFHYLPAVRRDSPPVP